MGGGLDENRDHQAGEILQLVGFIRCRSQKDNTTECTHAHQRIDDNVKHRCRVTNRIGRQDAEQLIEKVRTIHLQVVGNAPDGRPYAASDPQLLTWVHVSEVSQFLEGYLRYVDPQLPLAEQDRYYREVALTAERLGARDVPTSRQAIAARRPSFCAMSRNAVLLGMPSPSIRVSISSASASAWSIPMMA